MQKVVGMPIDTPSWLYVHDVIYGPFRSDPIAIIVKGLPKYRWEVGSTIVITGFTTQWDKYHQVRKITSTFDYGPNLPNNPENYRVLYLNESIVHPTTYVDSQEYAVEVGLLSRNVLFTSSVANGSLIGGHFWIFNTPNVPQKIFGVEIKNFGQQGTLGRYPIHVHYSGDSSSTIISRNSIHKSFQRCIVIHGTC
jgi:hypothetical protein